MSDITDQIRRFRAGEISREQLVRDLGSRTYAIPSYKKDWPADHYEQLVRIEERDIFEEGTFGGLLLFPLVPSRAAGERRAEASEGEHGQGDDRLG